jgi:hypothetical protein
MGLSKGDINRVKGTLSMEVAAYLQNKKRKELSDLEGRYDATITLQGDSTISTGDGDLQFSA